MGSHGGYIPWNSCQGLHEATVGALKLEFLRQILRRLERAAEIADVLTVNVDPRIVRKRFGLGFANGFKVGDHGKESTE